METLEVCRHRIAHARKGMRWAAEVACVGEAEAVLTREDREVLHNQHKMQQQGENEQVCLADYQAKYREIQERLHPKGKAKGAGKGTKGKGPVLVEGVAPRALPLFPASGIDWDLARSLPPLAVC